MAEAFAELTGRRGPEWFACSDPPGQPLGSGGGTAHLLHQAWRANSPDDDFGSWLRHSRKLVIHSGGQSRRLPAYAPTGKLLMPIPVFRWAHGQRLDQSLLDLQLPDYERVLAQAPSGGAVLIASGDVLLRFGRKLPPFPKVDVLGLGMWVAPETAKDFGVYFVPRKSSGELAFFLQKPALARIHELAEQYLSLVDTGMWLLSERAIQVLMRRCGWDHKAQQFRDGQPCRYELYAEFGLSLGNAPVKPDREISALSCAVVPLPEAEFYHFGTNRQMIESVSALHNLVLDGSKTGRVGARRHPEQVNLNSRLEAPLRREGDQRFWIENSIVPAGWQLASDHVLTGVPENQWPLQLEPGSCLDFVPVGADEVCIRAYGFGDTFSGKAGEQATVWLGRPLAEWCAARRLDLEQCGIDGAMDIQQAPLFPVVRVAELDREFIRWLLSASPADEENFSRLWRELPRLSAAQLCERVNLARLFQQRRRLLENCLTPMLRNSRWSVFFRLDLEATAGLFARSGASLPEPGAQPDDEPLQAVHDSMFRSAVLRHRGDPEWRRLEAAAFEELRRLILAEAQLSPARPHKKVLADQIIWARSPVRLDLAGGWTDTPPYCIEHGGSVLNLAVDINGQPPIQVFAKTCAAPEVVLRSIDLGVEERLRTFQELDSFGQPGSPFGLAKAAVALAGFLPRFHAEAPFASLKQQLEDFGGGIELSLLAAVPKGSGLGTSSILAATVLAALSELCALNWDRNALVSRTLALEQMLTTGGGWQDQAGALFRGVKLTETSPGLGQVPTLRWLPNGLFGPDLANHSILLYYTGITRLAKNILAEIVRGMFLNSPARLRCLEEIGLNARAGAEAIQRCDYQLLAGIIRNSWALNQQLDPGTNPAPVQDILGRVSDYLAAAKLLGAGGGGYLLMFAKDITAALKIKEVLNTNPPNPTARFVNFCVSETGLEVTRS